MTWETNLFVLPQVWGQTCTFGRSNISTETDNDIAENLLVPQLKTLRRFLYRHIFILFPNTQQNIPMSAFLK